MYYRRDHTVDVKTCFQQTRYVFDVIVSHERYLFSVFRGIMPAIFGRFSKNLSTSRAPEKYFTRLLK